MYSWLRPRRETSAATSSRWFEARLGETPVTQRARAPSASLATCARYVLSTPPEKATSAEPISERIARSAPSFERASDSPVARAPTTSPPRSSSSTAGLFTLTFQTRGAHERGRRRGVSKIALKCFGFKKLTGRECYLTRAGRATRTAVTE